MRKAFVTLALLGSVLLPSVSSAKDFIRLGNVIAPAGFCVSKNVDGIAYLGVRFDGTVYKLWLDKNATAPDRLNEQVNQANAQRRALGMAEFSVLEEAQFRAKVMADNTVFQMFYVSKGQDHQCKYIQ